MERVDEIGLAIGIAWTEAGGDLMPVEGVVDGCKGALMLTGQLGEVMQESAQAALSYTRSHAMDLGILTSISTSLTSTSTCRRGRSQGRPVCRDHTATALISALIQRPSTVMIAMTGEITLRGRVLPIGGLKEKVLAAHRAGSRLCSCPSRTKKT